MGEASKDCEPLDGMRERGRRHNGLLKMLGTSLNIKGNLNDHELSLRWQELAWHSNEGLHRSDVFTDQMSWPSLVTLPRTVLLVQAPAPDPRSSRKRSFQGSLAPPSQVEEQVELKNLSRQEGGVRATGASAGAASSMRAVAQRIIGCFSLCGTRQFTAVSSTTWTTQTTLMQWNNFQTKKQRKMV